MKERKNFHSEQIVKGGFAHGKRRYKVVPAKPPFPLF
jgi:hypothetical protein